MDLNLCSLYYKLTHALKRTSPARIDMQRKGKKSKTNFTDKKFREQETFTYCTHYSCACLMIKIHMSMVSKMLTVFGFVIHVNRVMMSLDNKT